MTTYEDWLSRNELRRAPEVDFGTTWTTARRPGTTWRVSWNTGSHELIAVSRAGDDMEVLGWYPDVDTAATVLGTDWAEQAQRPDGLDTARNHAADWNEAEADYRANIRDDAQQLRDELRDPPRWQEYLATCEREIVDEYGELRWRPFINLDYDDWDCLSREPTWPAYLDMVNALPDNVAHVPSYDQWAAAHRPNGPAALDPPAVYGLVIRPDGTTTELDEPVTACSVEQHVGTPVVDVARVRPERVQGRSMHMFVDDFGHAKGLPVNPLATVLYGNTWPILGPAVMFDDNDAPLPGTVIDDLRSHVAPVEPTRQPPASNAQRVVDDDDPALERHDGMDLA